MTHRVRLIPNEYVIDINSCRRIYRGRKDAGGYRIKDVHLNSHDKDE